MVRHGQAEHNVLFESGRKEQGRKLLDPSLTALGVEQAKDVAKQPIMMKLLEEKLQDQSLLLVVSPLRRTLQTALNAFGSWIKTEAKNGKLIKFICNADIQETGEINCDCGSPLSTIRSEFEKEHPFIDFSELAEDWHLKVGEYRDQGPLLTKRFNRFTRWLMDQPEETIVVVAHHNIFLANLGISFKNCEVREYVVSGTEWTPTNPQLSDKDDQLSEAEKLHLSIYDGHNRNKMKSWGLLVPERFR